MPDPLDGRYRPEVARSSTTSPSKPSNRTRAHVEVEWLIFLSINQVLPGATPHRRRDRLPARDPHLDGRRRHRAPRRDQPRRTDVKAVSISSREKLDAAPANLEQTNLPQIRVSTSSPPPRTSTISPMLNVKAAVEEIWLPAAHSLTAALSEWLAPMPPLMLLPHARPTGLPSTLGKEIAVLAHRLNRQIARIESAQFLGKFNGATGTYGAPRSRSRTRTVPTSSSIRRRPRAHLRPTDHQIESHDWMSELFADVARFNRIARNLATDFWTCILWATSPKNLATPKARPARPRCPTRSPHPSKAEAGFEISRCSTPGSHPRHLRLQRDLTGSSL